MMPLYLELNRWMGLPFTWGETDCTILCADWVRQQCGFDPAAGMRFAYNGPGELQRVFGWFDDPLAVLAPRMDRLPRADAPGPGDVGLVQFAGMKHPHCGVCIGRLWAAKAERGIIAEPGVRVIAAWGVGYA